MGMLGRRKKQEIKAPAQMIEKVVEDEDEVEVKEPVIEKQEDKVAEVTEEETTEEPVEETKEEEKDWSIVDITTQTQPVIYNSKTKEQLSLMEAVAEILNRTQ